MTRTNLRLFWGGWVMACALWLAFNPGIFSAAGVFALREHFVQFSGVLAIAAMSVAMILSLRPRWPEAWLGGLDKMYRLHKWLGIAALGLAVFHWLWAQGPKWAVGAGLLARPERGPRPEITDPVRAFLLSLESIFLCARKFAATDALPPIHPQYLSRCFLSHSTTIAAS